MKPDINPEGWSFQDCVDDIEWMSEVDIWKGNNKVLAKALTELKQSNDKLQVELFNEVLKLQAVVAECKTRLLRINRSALFNQPDAVLPVSGWAVQTEAREALETIQKAGL
jgi:hypothetical protein